MKSKIAILLNIDDYFVLMRILWRVNEAKVEHPELLTIPGERGIIPLPDVQALINAVQENNFTLIKDRPATLLSKREIMTLIQALGDRDADLTEKLIENCNDFEEVKE